MKINSPKTALTFGTRIIVCNRDDLLKDIRSKFSSRGLKAIEEPMCDFRTSVTKLPHNIFLNKKNFNPKPKRFMPKKKYKLETDSYGYTGGIDICTGGIVVGKKKIGMFHIAPTLDSLDLLRGARGDVLGKSIDDFANKYGEIKKAIIVGGRKWYDYWGARGSESMNVNALIRKRFYDRGISTTILSDFKKAEMDLFYSRKKDRLEIGVLNSSSIPKISDVFGEIALKPNDELINMTHNSSLW